MNMEEKVKDGTATEPENKEEVKTGKNLVKELFKKAKAKFNALPEAERKKRKDIVVVSAMVFAFSSSCSGCSIRKTMRNRNRPMVSISSFRMRIRRVSVATR